jgi:transcriptional regulator with XRE-family HTH domain
MEESMPSGTWALLILDLIGAIGLSARKLAAAAKVSPETVIRFERGERLRKRTIDSLRQVLEAAGLEFTDGRKPGVRVGKR